MLTINGQPVIIHWEPVLAFGFSVFLFGFLVGSIFAVEYSWRVWEKMSRQDHKEPPCKT